jgi:D-proline reductase (dithiol) PrdB
MVRLADLPEIDQAHLLGKACEPLPGEPFVHGPPLTQRRVAIVTTAGLHPAGQPNFDLRDTDYRVIPGDVDGRDLVMSHSSVNFDRSGFQQDINVVFPLERLRELADAGEIGSVASFHYALNGAGWEPHEIEPTAAELARMLAADKVDAAVLVPV